MLMWIAKLSMACAGVSRASAIWAPKSLTLTAHTRNTDWPRHGPSPTPRPLAYHRDNFFKRSREYTRLFLHKITGAALVSAEEHLAAQRIRERVTVEFLDAFTLHDLDALVIPSTPYTAFGSGRPRHRTWATYPTIEPGGATVPLNSVRI